MNANDIRESVDEFVKAIEQSQIIMFPGGFSAGDEPDGSAKFFATAFRNAKMTEAVMRRGRHAGRSTWKMDCHFVAPRPRLA